MSRCYETDERVTRVVTVDGIVAEVEAHFEGWYSEGDAWGYGCEPPDGDEEITERTFNYAYNEETGEDVTITDDLKKKIEAELWKRR